MKTLYRKFKNLVKSWLYPLYEKRLARFLLTQKIPNHIGVILDGNRRWSKANPSQSGDISAKRGHLAGANKIIDLLDWSESAGVKIVTLWLLSNQNLARPKIELDPLLEIIDIAVKNLNELGRWEINPVGSMELLPESLQTTLRTAQLQSKGRGKLMVNVAIGYGGRDEISDAVKAYLSAPENKTLTGIELADKFQPTAIESYLYTAGLPDPDLLIRTSGEQRLGGFMLWQSANSEVYFCDAYWPDFRHLDFLRALRSYSQRQRRFGL